MEREPGLAALSDSELTSLAVSFREGSLAHAVSGVALRKAAPGIDADAVAGLIRLHESGWTPPQLALLCAEVRKARHPEERLNHLIELVLSGPEHAAVPRRQTAVVFREMIEEAQEEILVASYAIHNGRELFARMAQRQEESPGLAIALYLNIPRKQGDTTLASQVVAQYRHAFVSKDWPSPALPKLLYYRPSLEQDWRARASMHAKIVIVDRRKILVTSANLTKAAHDKNVEIGLVVKHPGTAARVADYLEGLAAVGEFVEF